MQITYGQNLPLAGVGDWPGLDTLNGPIGVPPHPPVSDPQPGGSGIVALVSTQPAFVSNTGNVSTGNTSTSNTTPGVTTPTTQTAASPTITGSLLNYLFTVVTNPLQHIVAVVVLLLIGRYLYKHFIKGLL